MGSGDQQYQASILISILNPEYGINFPLFHIEKRISVIHYFFHVVHLFPFHKNGQFFCAPGCNKPLLFRFAEINTKDQFISCRLDDLGIEVFFLATSLSQLAH